MATSDTPTRQIRFVKPFLPPAEELVEDFKAIVDSGWLTKGPYLQQYEQAAAQATDADHAVGVGSCTTGLMLLLMSLEKPGEVILPSFSFVATALPVVWNGLEPVFVDCREDSFNLDPNRVEEAITPRTRAILATHVHGNPADVEALQRIADEHGLKLFFDAAHGFGATWRGRGLGNLGDGSVFSTTPTKLVVTGEGGMVTTRHADLAEMVRIAREYGNPGDYDNVYIGLNGRLPEINCLLGIKTLELLEENIARRRAIAARYREALGELAGLSFQEMNSEGTASYKDFAILVDPDTFGLTRDELEEHLKGRGIATKRYFDPPIHTQKAFAAWRQRCEGRLPVTEKIAAQVLCLPIYAGLSDGEVEYVIGCVTEAASNARRP
ncbi:MAG: DegT/DnrJ/EryC1/StrS family aminotransferase [Armatimonadetes bacterium]|nr:DegT/DnrJ/EryC1/StrS family aminotransferase [Armatimonadota bacterium]